MRWLVSVTSLGKSESEPLQIEADTWQGALQLARAERGDGESLGSLTIEVSEAGCRAVDASSLLSYDVRPLADGEVAPGTRASVAPILGRTSGLPPRPSASPAKRPSGSSPAPQPARPSAAPEPAAVVAAPPPQASVAPVPQTRPSQPPADVVIVKPQVIEGPPSSPPPSSRPSRPDSSGIPLQVVFKREEERSEAKPLTYREYVYVVPANTSDQDVHTLLYHQLELVRASLDRLAPGKLVNLAVFDAQFQGKPQGTPLATLTWKDWRPDAIVYTPRGAITNGAAAAPVPVAPVPVAPVPVAPVPVAPVALANPKTAASEPPPAEAPPPAPRDFPLTEKSPEGAYVAGAVTAVRDPFANAAAPPALAPPPNAAPPAASSPVHGSMAPAPDTMHSVQRRVAGDELVADLFDVMHDLHFLRDALEGGDFCLAVAMEKLPSEAGWIHLYDIDRREFVVTSARGGRAGELVLRRHAEREKLLADAMRGRKAIVIADAKDPAAQEAAVAERFELVGARSIVVAPVMQAGRFLGAIELVNPLDGHPFTSTDGDAIAYIANQFAEFVASRGVVTDEERIAARRSRP